MNWVVINKLSELTGLTEQAIRGYKKKGIWLEGKHYRKTNGRLWFNIKEITSWVEGKAV